MTDQELFCYKLGVRDFQMWVLRWLDVTKLRLKVYKGRGFEDELNELEAKIKGGIPAQPPVADDEGYF